jgi:hypothetical protein
MVLEKQELINSRKREKIMKNIVEVNKQQTKRTIQRIKEIKIWFSDRISEIDKPLAIPTKSKREEPKLVRSEVKKVILQQIPLKPKVT